VAAAVARDCCQYALTPRRLSSTLTTTIQRSDPRSAKKSATPREREALALVAEGRTNASIARQLRLTEKTVETYVRSILGSSTSRRTATPTAACSPW